MAAHQWRSAPAAPVTRRAAAACDTSGAAAARKGASGIWLMVMPQSWCDDTKRGAYVQANLMADILCETHYPPTFSPATDCSTASAVDERWHWSSIGRYPATAVPCVTCDLTTCFRYYFHFKTPRHSLQHIKKLSSTAISKLHAVTRSSTPHVVHLYRV